MRWRYLGDAASPDADARAATLARIDAWWAAFTARHREIDVSFREGGDFELPPFMQEALQPVVPDLSWEFGPALRGPGHRLVITPEANKHLRPLVATLIERAPALDGWEFYAYRPAGTIDDMASHVRARTGGTAHDLKFRATPCDDGRVDLQFVSPRARTARDTALHEAFVVVETLLGEEALDHWIGAIDVEAPPSWLGKMLGGGGAQGLPLSELAPTFRKLVDAYAAALPDPHQLGENGQILQLGPEEADDYPEQHDMLIAKTWNLPLWQATHAQGFSSQRFSRNGDLFCYLKVDGSEGLDEQGFADKSEIEDAIDAVLKPDALGCHIGGGTGLRYSYVDLVLRDPEAALPKIVARMREGRLPKRSWLQFFDADLCGEWLGIYPDSPPPPGF